MRRVILMIFAVTLSACTHTPKLVWEKREEPQRNAAQRIDLTQQNPLEQGEGAPMQATHSMMDMARMASNESIALFPLDGPVASPFANRFPGQNNGFAPTTTTSGGYPVRDPNVVVFPLDDGPQQRFSQMANNRVGQATQIVTSSDAPVSLTRSMPVVTLPPPVSAQPPLPTPFLTDGGLAPNIAPPQPAAEPESRRTMLTGY